MKSVFSSAIELVKIIIIALLIVVPLRAFVFQPFLVRGASMEPNFHSGDYLIVDELSYRFREPQRGEVIVFKFPQDTSQRFIKRIVGLPGDTVEINQGRIFISGVMLNETGYLPVSLGTSGETKITLREDEYFVLGDNRPFSSDSRRWGVLLEEHIIGRTFLRLFPPNAFAKVNAPEYSLNEL